MIGSFDALKAKVDIAKAEGMVADLRRPWKIRAEQLTFLKALAEGAAGQVWVAELQQQDKRRKVAVKKMFQEGPGADLTTDVWDDQEVVMMLRLGLLGGGDTRNLLGVNSGMNVAPHCTHLKSKQPWFHLTIIFQLKPLGFPQASTPIWSRSSACRRCVRWVECDNCW